MSTVTQYSVDGEGGIERKMVLDWRLVFGDAPALWSIHDQKPWLSPYFPLKLVESVLRGVAQVCFANNPWCGLLMLVGFFIFDWQIGLAAVLASLLAIATSKFFQQPDSVVVSGLQNYSAVLVGTVTIALYPVFVSTHITWHVWAAIVVMSVFSVPVGMGLSVLVSPVKLPFYTLPFNVTCSLMFIGFHSAGFRLPTDDITEDVVIESEVIPSNTTEFVDQQSHSIDWSQFLVGVLKSMGQVYAVDDLTASIFIWVGMLITSPALTIASFIGGLCSSFIGLLVIQPPYLMIYNGVWGYNGLLSTACIIFFLRPNFLSVVLAILDGLFTGFIMAGLIAVFSVNNLPVFTFPFCISSLLFLAIADAVPGLERVEKLTYPEEHYLEGRKKGHALNTQHNVEAGENSPTELALLDH